MRCLPLTLLLATTACSMTPRLTLPTPPVAEAYPIASGAEALPEWRGMFGDPRLQSLIALSLDANRDLRIAALNAEGHPVHSAYFSDLPPENTAPDRKGDLKITHF